jgi:hypothetical protein
MTAQAKDETMAEYFWRTSVGTVWIRPQPGYPGRYWLGVEGVGALGSYSSAEAAAHDFARGHTGWPAWDNISNTVNAPRALSEWQPGRQLD